jgi:cytochrome P450
VNYEHAQNLDEAHAIIRQAREQAPIAMGLHAPELLTYELVRTVLGDPRFRMPQGVHLAAQGITSGPLWDRVSKLLFNIDGAEHRRLRLLVSNSFTPRAIARQRETVVDIVTELVDHHTADGRCDVVADIARKFPIPIICALLGAPAEDWELFSRWADDIFKTFELNVAADEPAILAAWQKLDAYIDDMVARRRHTLTDDLISELICAEDEGDRISVDELRSLVGILLLGGTQTTRNQLAASVHVLCDHPDQWALLAQRPELAAKAVEETVRYSPIACGVPRVAVDDVVLAGFVIPAGTLIQANIIAANHDPAVYDDPDRLDITRDSVPAIQSFGGGMHYCLGAHLARLELAEALAVMTRRMPNARRSGPAPWKPLRGQTGPITLPIEFDTGH